MDYAPFVLRYKQETIQINTIKRIAVSITEIAVFLYAVKKRFSVFVDTENRIIYIVKSEE